MSYEVRGLPEKLTSHDNASVGSGAIVNQVEFSYNDFGQTTISYQAHGAAVNTSTCGGDHVTMPTEGDLFLQHVESPYHQGRLAQHDRMQTARNPACGDTIELQLLLEDDSRIDEAWFDGAGCITSRAAASILCEQIEDRTLAELQQFTPQQMLDLIDLRLTPLRQRCALVAYHALQGILKSLQASARFDQL